MKIAIRNAHIVDPFSGEDKHRDLFIEGGYLVEKLSGDADRDIDASAYLLAPGLIDAHCHLRDPGFEYREDLVSGTRAAARGGYVAVAAMPNTRPVCDTPVVVRYLLDKGQREGFCEILPVGAATKNESGEELAEIGLMKEAGAVAVSDDGQPIATADMMKKVLLYAHHFGLPVMDHCEDKSLSHGGSMNEGRVSTELGLRGIPTAAEEIMVARDIILAEYLDLPVHLSHLSSAGSIELVRRAKARGVKLSCDSCPHYFTLTEEACRDFDPNTKMHPPLRSEKDRRAIIEGLMDGSIDIIATDHAPHHEDEEELEFALANNGIIGLETAFSLAYTWLCEKEKMPLIKLLSLFTVAPARLFSLGDRSLKPGNPANLALFDLQNEYVVDKKQMHSKARNTPFDGWKLKGATKMTIWKGRIRYEA